MYCLEKWENKWEGQGILSVRKSGNHVTLSQSLSFTSTSVYLLYRNVLQVVELLLSRGANKEHRNVSDYTPLSLAASGGYVNIIKLLLSHGAEINSRTGSKLGISPLMLAAMNGHTQAVKLLLDMGSDINAQVRVTVTPTRDLAPHCMNGHTQAVKLLLDMGSNINAQVCVAITPARDLTPY